MDVIQQALARGEKTLSEYDAKRLLAAYGIPVVTEVLVSNALVALGKIGLENPMVKEIDINPVIIVGNRPVAVDALVVLETAPEGIYNALPFGSPLKE